MFNPSKSLLFRTVPALNKLKIHQQLPLNPRESKQLLNLLTTSFRQHLDTEHGEFKPETGHTTGQRATAHQQSSRPRRRSASEPWRSPTDRHMHSMLTNPLFASASNGKAQQAASDPMEIFDSVVSRGMMDIKHAHAILQAKTREIVQSPLPSIRDGMRDSGAGLKVLRWLISSGATNSLEFLKNEGFAAILMQYMVAEGLQEVIWTWIKKSFEGISTLSSLEGPDWHQARKDIVTPLLLLVKAEAKGPVGLDDAYLCLSRAASYLNGLPAVKKIHILGPPGRFLIHETLKSDSLHPPPSESSFESFLGLIPTISRNVEYYFAHLTLIHPTKPSADLALSFLRETVESKPEQSDRPHKADTEKMNLGLDTAKYLLANDRYNEALWVMDLLRTHFPKQLGIQQRRQLEQAKAEASSLELLEGLAVA